MYAMLRLESVGDNLRQRFKYDKHRMSPEQYFRLVCNPLCHREPGVFRKTETGWAALESKRDYTESNSCGSRGVYLCFLLQSGHVYRVVKQLNWTKWATEYVQVTEDGEIVSCEENP